MSIDFRRRVFLRRSGLVVVGVAAGATVGNWRGSGPIADAHAADNEPKVSFEARLKELKLELPPVTPPTNVYAPTVRVGNLLYVSGHTPPKLDDNAKVTGKVGADLTLEEGREAARRVGLRVLATIRDSLGSLDRIVRLVKTFGMVNSAPTFYDQPLVINGFSELMAQLLGDELGKGARSAVGLAALPGNAAVEVESVWQVR